MYVRKLAIGIKQPHRRFLYTVREKKLANGLIRTNFRVKYLGEWVAYIATTDYKRSNWQVKIGEWHSVCQIHHFIPLQNFPTYGISLYWYNHHELASQLAIYS